MTNDRNPLHVDEKYSISKGFQSKVVHGNLQNCFISYFVGECLPIKSVVLLSNSIEYLLPVYLNQQLIFKAKVTGIFESVRVVELKFFFINNNGKTVSKGFIKIKIF